MPLPTALEHVQDELQKFFGAAENDFAAYKLELRSTDDAAWAQFREDFIESLRKRSSLADETRHAYLANAMIALVRAEIAEEAGENERSWYHVSLARYQLGMVEGDFAASSRVETFRRAGRLGSDETREKRKSIPNQVKALLVSQRPAAGWVSYKHAAEGIAQELGNYLTDGNIEGFSNYPFEYILRLLKESASMQRAFQGQK